MVEYRCIPGDLTMTKLVKISYYRLMGCKGGPYISGLVDTTGLLKNLEGTGLVRGIDRG